MTANSDSPTTRAALDELAGALVAIADVPGLAGELALQRLQSLHGHLLALRKIERAYEEIVANAQEQTLLDLGASRLQ